MKHAVLMIHGHAPVDSLAPLAAELAPRYEILAESRPGYGGRPVAREATADGIAAEIERAHHARGPLILVGHSFGAYLALLLAVRGNLRLARVVGLAPVAHWSPEEAAQMSHMADAAEAGIDLSPGVLPAWFSEAYRSATPGLEQLMVRWAASSQSGLVAELRAAAQADDLRPRLMGIGVPVLLRVGEADVVTPPARAREIAAAIPEARLEVVTGRGHMLGLEDVVDTAGSLLAWAGT